jgi:outer membrane protein W
MRTTLLSLMLLVSSLSFAQTEKGSVFVGGGFSMRTGESSSQFLLNPTVGFLVADNFMFGGTVSYNAEKLGDLKSNEFGIGPFARYYFGSSNTKPFVVSEFDFVTSKTQQNSSSNEIKSNGTRFLIGLGFAAFINEVIAVEGISGYTYSKYKNVDGNGGFTLRLGFGIYFNRKSTDDLKKNVMGKSN